MRIRNRIYFKVPATYLFTEARLAHDRGVAAVAGTAGLGLEHVVVVALLLVVPVVKAFRAQRHALKRSTVIKILRRRQKRFLKKYRVHNSSTLIASVLDPPTF
jgi:hypothetical protein